MTDFPLMKSSFQIETEIKGTLIKGNQAAAGNWEIAGNGVCTLHSPLCTLQAAAPPN